ncbi:patatin-like phospholipase family protein [Vagococcus zengguangii]|uniref:Patatin-like phospholipase family protein n=1 Tax=Vagococcus zengguangii TaxID=2571750 RepID=A0A4D7CWJ1_9ENTE|nr:patatin-like phospholipase family protein [Vagococcus zengguangii]QCI86697.1 patatin-like phospholipase family protein [Vagococcus zengguangii]TLG78437.1 patatin-like phospholipase family protein [Vagococcus zengguangii]
MKFGELVEDYQLSWSEIDSFIQNARPIVIRIPKDQVFRVKWFEGYYRPKQTESKQFFYIYGSKILLGLRWRVRDENTLVLEEALLNGNYHIERDVVIKLLQAAHELANVRSILVETASCEPSWRYWLKQAGAETDSEGLVLTPTYRQGLVLSGGGAKGAYQIGAWQAFNEVDWTINIITGTSVGALNGGLIMQGDFEAAKQMWEEIATDKILDFPLESEGSVYQPEQLLDNIQAFIKAALLNKGVSTEPLKTMIDKLLIPRKIKQNLADFYLCTTRLRSMREQVIEIKNQPDELVSQWLLASSSFFPAMSATDVQGEAYIDGGYRNNIPLDVALERGATSLMVVDIVGPGVTKINTIAPEIPVRMLRSHWSLGTVLLFDHERSKWNIKLGYLEAKKMLGDLSGRHYSFNYAAEQQPLRAINYRLLRRVFSDKQIKVLSNDELDAIIRKIRKLSNDRVSVHTWLFDLFEHLAKILGVVPTQVYSYESFIEEIVMAYDQARGEKTQVSADMLLSMGEYWHRYFGNTPLISERAQLLLLTDLRLQDKISTDIYKKIALINAPLVIMAQMLATFIEERGNEDGSRI